MSAALDLAAEFVTDVTNLIGKYVTRIASPLIQVKIRSASLVSTVVTLWMKLWAFGVVSLIAMFAISLSALIIYACMYVSMMPQLEHTIPVHFDFSTPNDIPTAHINLLDDHFIYYPYHSPSSIPTRSHFLYPNQAYGMNIRMNVPLENAKHGIGMMTVNTALFNHDRILANASRSFISSHVHILHPPLPSLPYRIIRSLLAIPLWFVPSILLSPFVSAPPEPIAFVQLPCMEYFHEDAQYPTTLVRVELRSRHIEQSKIRDATLILHVQLSGIRYFMYHWFYSTAFVLISMIMATELFWFSLLASLVYINWNQHKPSPRNSFSVPTSYPSPAHRFNDDDSSDDNDDDNDHGGDDDDDDDDDDDVDDEHDILARPFRTHYKSKLPLPSSSHHSPPSYSVATSTATSTPPQPFQGRSYRVSSASTQTTDESMTSSSLPTTTSTATGTSPPIRQRHTRAGGATRKSPSVSNASTPEKETFHSHDE